MLFYQKQIQAPKNDFFPSNIKEEVKESFVAKSRNISSEKLINFTSSAPKILTAPPVTSDEDDSLPDFTLIESLQRYPSAYPTKDRFTNKLTELAG